MKTFSIRMEDEMYTELSNGTDNMSEEIRKRLEAISCIRKKSEREIKDLFTNNEWMFLRDTLNGTLVEDIFRVSPECLATHCAESCEFAPKWEIDLDALQKKCLSLTGAQVESVYHSIEEWWDKQEFEVINKKNLPDDAQQVN